MQRIILDIPDNKVNFFMELLKNLGVKRAQMLTNEQKEFVDDLGKTCFDNAKQKSRHLESTGSCLFVII